MSQLVINPSKFEFHDGDFITIGKFIENFVDSHYRDDCQWISFKCDGHIINLNFEVSIESFVTSFSGNYYEQPWKDIMTDVKVKLTSFEINDLEVHYDDDFKFLIESKIIDFISN